MMYKPVIGFPHNSSDVVSKLIQLRVCLLRKSSNVLRCEPIGLDIRVVGAPINLISNL